MISNVFHPTCLFLGSTATSWRPSPGTKDQTLKAVSLRLLWPGKEPEPDVGHRGRADGSLREVPPGRSRNGQSSDETKQTTVLNISSDVFFVLYVFVQ